MAKEPKKTKTMRDSSGNEIPLKYVDAYDKKRDKVVRAVVAETEKMRAALEKYMASTVAAMNALAGERGELAERGNFSARSFDGLLEVAVRQAWTITLDERVTEARSLMLGYATKSLGKLGQDGYVVQRLVEAAFKTDSQGFLSRTRIAELLRLHVEDAEWERGAALLQSAMTTQRGKRYVQVRKRASVQEDFRQIRLDTADCWPKEAEV